VDLTPVLWTLAAITMIAGNVIALAQMNIKRLLAYSSIAHAGYMAMAFVSYGKSNVVGNSISGMLFYLVAYSLTTLGAWGVVIALEKPGMKARSDRLCRIGEKISSARRCHGDLYALLYRYSV
jgi:NADH-quinone oxidoreductase subunit N